jgi:hypothetical protein
VLFHQQGNLLQVLFQQLLQLKAHSQQQDNLFEVDSRVQDNLVLKPIIQLDILKAITRNM